MLLVECSFSTAEVITGMIEEIAFFCGNLTRVSSGQHHVAGKGGNLLRRDRDDCHGSGDCDRLAVERLRLRRDELDITWQSRFVLARRDRLGVR